MWKFYFVPLCLTLSTVTARAVLPVEAIASLARLKPREGTDNDPSIDSVLISYTGCDGRNSKTGNTMKRDISDAWNDAVKLAARITDINTGTDVGSFDFFGPNILTDGAGYKILKVYQNAASYDQAWFVGWRVNAFCPSADKDLLRFCADGIMAFEWNTLCSDGRCVCDTRDAQGRCNNEDKWRDHPENSYINIQFCDGWFQSSSLQEVIDAGKRAPMLSKYNLDFYWHNRAKILFHELLHGATVGQTANENLGITDLKITILKDNKPGEYEVVPAYGPLNAKLLARTIREKNFDHVRQNSDNWSAYALAKYVQKEVGVYPILPLADGHTYGDDAEPLPNTLLLINKDKVYVNNNYYTANLISQTPPQHLYLEEGRPDLEAKDFGYNPDSDYPQWYIERIKKATNGDLDGTGPMPQEQPLEPNPPTSQPAMPSNQGKTLEIFWESEPRGAPVCTGPHGTCEPLRKVDMFYYFYIGQAGVGVDPCKADPLNKNSGIPAPKQENVPVIQGEWDVDVPGLGKCKYQGIGRTGDSGDNGWLHCPDKPAIMCKPDQRPNDFCNTEITVNAKAVSFCDF